MVTLKLGHFDKSKKPDSWKSYLRPYHEGNFSRIRFRGDANGLWRPPKSLPGSPIRELQQHLKDLGYLPQGVVDGIFGYRTHAAVILFQEYMRSVAGMASLGAPDGLVGPKTRNALQEALHNNLTCVWTDTSTRGDSAWLKLLKSLREKYRQDYPRLLPNLFDRESDTLPPERWQVSRAPVHILGIRRKAWTASLDRSGKRMNNDVFVVIANGTVMHFFGSTDPNPRMSNRADGMPFLCKGQHSYRFGYHKRSNAEKCYRALRPARHGVRVVRDSDGDKKLSAGDRLDEDANDTINLHWSGRGTSNWSAGCQVIGGAVYLDHAGRVVDCWDHAAVTYNKLGDNKGRGAYDLMFSWISVCSPDITTAGTIPYTLIEEDELKELAPRLHQTTLSAFKQAVRTVASHDPRIEAIVRERAPKLMA
jgi:hypothetical protein